MKKHWFYVYSKNGKFAYVKAKSTKEAIGKFQENRKISDENWIAATHIL